MGSPTNQASLLGWAPVFGIRADRSMNVATARSGGLDPRGVPAVITGLDKMSL